MGNKSDIKVTVAMPAYNAAKYIQEAIESILSQDYEAFELLIMDDCSRDNTWKVLQRYKKHPRVRLFKNRKNLGVGRTRNKLVRLARGIYITPCDADDIMLSGNLKRLSNFLDGHKKYGAVYADMLVLETKRGRLLRPPYVVKINETFKWDLLQNLVNHPGSMIRKDLVIKVGGYDETVYSIDDWDLWLKLAEITKIKYLKGEIYYVWRRHPGALSCIGERRWQKECNMILVRAIKRRYGPTQPLKGFL